jgi:hypothetical protein
MSRAPFEVKRFPKERHDIVDALEVGVRRHMVLRELIEDAEVLQDTR